jgi:hypothetical protein
MNQPPKQLDGARLVCFAKITDAVKPTGKTRHEVGGMVLGSAKALAICQYENENDYYLFYCDDNWSVLTDTWHEKIEGAKHQAEFEYAGISKCWNAVN